MREVSRIVLRFTSTDCPQSVLTCKGDCLFTTRLRTARGVCAIGAGPSADRIKRVEPQWRVATPYVALLSLSLRRPRHLLSSADEGLLKLGDAALENIVRLGHLLHLLQWVARGEARRECSCWLGCLLFVCGEGTPRHERAQKRVRVRAHVQEQVLLFTRVLRRTFCSSSMCWFFLVRHF